MNNVMYLIAYLFQNILAQPEEFINNQTLPLGYIVLSIIGIPVLVLLIASFLIKPRSSKITGLFLGWVFLMFSAFIGAVFVLSYVLSIFY